MKFKDELYASVPLEVLDWDYRLSSPKMTVFLAPRVPDNPFSHRWPRILAGIQCLQPDVMCLQEVDRYDQVEAELSALG